MTKFALRFVIIFTLLVFLNLDAFAESWRGITPIHSNRADVQKLFGKPIRIFDDVDHYEFDNMEVIISYVPKPCGGLSDFGDFDVAKDTVLEIRINQMNELSLKKFLKTLKIKNMNKLKTSNELDTGIVHYTDKERGISFAVNSDKTIHSYILGAKASDSYLLCRENTEEKQ